MNLRMFLKAGDTREKSWKKSKNNFLIYFWNENSINENVKNYSNIVQEVWAKRHIRRSYEWN